MTEKENQIQEDTPRANTLKVRDDVEPVEFTMDSDQAVFDSHKPAWADGEVGRETLRSRIEPWLTALVQADHLNLLVGSGLTKAVTNIAGASVPNNMSSQVLLDTTKLNKAAKASAKAAGREDVNFEDQIRVANQLLQGLKILEPTKANSLASKLEQAMEDFADSIRQGEANLIGAISASRDQAFTTLVSFLMSFASRTGTRDRLSIFTTNYDRVLEVGAELAGLHLIDRFVGSVAPIFRSSRLDLDLHYNPPGIRGEPRFVEGVARFTKLHGSLDWLDTGDAIRRIGLPFGAASLDPYLDIPGYPGDAARSLMIYPNPAKDRETAEFPYVELFRDWAAAAARPNTVTVTYGYSFGDEHINRVIKDALTIPSTHLVIISYDDPLGRIRNVYDEWGRKSQISLLVGPELGDLSRLTHHYLPKPSIDMASRRMGELLRQRHGDPVAAGSTGPVNQETQENLDEQENQDGAEVVK